MLRECKRKRQGKHMLPCKTGEWCYASSVQRIFFCLMPQQNKLIKYSKKINEKQTSFFQRPSNVYEFKAYRASLLELAHRNLQNL